MKTAGFIRVLTVALISMLLLGSVGTVAGPIEKVDVLIGFNDVIQTNALTSLGAEITHEYQLIPVVAARIPVTVVSLLENSPDIAFVEPDGEVHALQVIPWGIERIRAPIVHHHDIRGEDIKVAVLDTGIDLSHLDLVVHGGANFVGGTSWDDDNSHGTHVAGTIAALDNIIDVLGAAPQAELYSVKVLDANGIGTWGGLAQGIEWAVLNDMDIINMSLGGAGGHPAVDLACQLAWDAGLFLVAAAGNNGVVSYPALYDHVMAVGATDINNDVPWWSGSGPGLDIVAPGVDILSTQMGGGTSTKTGTSMACPHVAGTAALLMSFRPDYSNEQVWNRIIDAADRVGDPYYYGAGIVNANRAIPQLQLGIWTTYRSYQVGQVVDVHIRVTEHLEGYMSNQTVTIDLLHPDGNHTEHVVITGHNGNALFTFTAQQSGTYVVSGNTSKPGYLPGSSMWYVWVH